MNKLHQSFHSLLASLSRSPQDPRRNDAPADPQQFSFLIGVMIIFIFVVVIRNVAIGCYCQLTEVMRIYFRCFLDFFQIIMVHAPPGTVYVVISALTTHFILLMHNRLRFCDSIVITFASNCTLLVIYSIASKKTYVSISHAILVMLCKIVIVNFIFLICAWYLL